MQTQSLQTRLLALIAIIMTIAALKIGYPVLMPIILSFCIIASAWPITRISRNLGSPAVSYAITIIVLIAGLLAFFGIVTFALSQVVQNFGDRREEFEALFERAGQFASDNGIPTTSSGFGGYERVLAMMRALLSDAYSVLSYMGLVAVIVIMGFPEVPKLAYKFRREYDTSKNQVLSQTITEMADSLRSYLSVTMLTSFITGLASALWAFSLGLDLALIWGILNFLLNFIPVVGNLLGILPPTLYAFVQYGGWVMPLVVFSGFVVMQLAISNFIYPLLQSRGVSLPPITIILSLLFWGWVWGVAGGLLAVPMTAMLVIICSKFSSTRKFAAFAGGLDDDSEKEAAEQNADDGLSDKKAQ